LEKIATEIKNHGFIPGIWLAPFSVSETSRTFLQHPDWVVKKSNESPKISYNNWNKKIYSLDLSNPEVKKHIKNVFTVLKKAGFEYFKIDFLFSGAIPGKRYLKNITPIEAYRDGLATIRESIGDSFVLGCGAPLLPSLGFVDGMRVSEDTAPLYIPDSKIKLNAYNAIKNSVNRYFMNGKWWINDPDCLILRKEQSGLNKEIIEMYAYISGVLNYSIFQSDDLSLSLYDQVLLKALKYRGGMATVAELGNEKCKIVSIHPKFGKIELVANFEKGKYSLSTENTKSQIKKKTVLKEDGRLFHFYERDKNA
jgi:alpha-galactosidase